MGLVCVFVLLLLVFTGVGQLKLMDYCSAPAFFMLMLMLMRMRMRMLNSTQHDPCTQSLNHSRSQSSSSLQCHAVPSSIAAGTPCTLALVIHTCTAPVSGQTNC